MALGKIKNINMYFELHEIISLIMIHELWKETMISYFNKNLLASRFQLYYHIFLLFQICPNILQNTLCLIHLSNQCCLTKGWKNKWKIHCSYFGRIFFCLFFVVISCRNNIHNREWHKRCYITKLTISIKDVNAKFQAWNVVANNGVGERILQS